jgi:putative membrane-bound dehydrogenase-like protein
MSYVRVLRIALTGLMCVAWPRATGGAFPALYNSEPESSGSPVSAVEAVKRFELPPGFRATVFAAEPDVQNPIAMAWDMHGRLWVAENHTYAERAMRFDLTLRDRILIFTDVDGDGRADGRLVFTDGLQMLTSLEVGRGGVWVMCPPQLLFIPDRNHDNVPDGPPEVKLDGFTVAESNYHNFANGLRWGPDGWLYGRCGHSCPGRLGRPGTPDAERLPIEGGMWRYHPEREVVEVLTHGTTNPWGHDWDAHGELFFINTVNGHLWHNIPGAHFKESYGTDPNPDVYERLDAHADHLHYDRSGNAPDSRRGKANNLGGGHAHIGAMIYQAGQWPPEWRGRLFTLNMHGFRTNVERLERHGSGYLARHQADIFQTDDPWFRAIDIQQGPDGAAYVIDWSDVGECHEHNGVHRTSGRIYRFSHGEGERLRASELARLDEADVMRWLKHPNVWYERQLRSRLLGVATRGGQPTKAISALQQVLANEKDSVLRLRALWTLYSLGQTSPEMLRALLNERDEHLRVWAIRLLTDHQPLDSILGPGEHATPAPLPGAEMERFLALAQSDKSGLVRLTLASTLQRLPLAQRAELGAALAARIEDADDHNLPAMVWYGLIPLADADPQALVRVAEGSRWPLTLRWIARGLASRMDRQPEPVNALLTFAARADGEIQTALLHGIHDGLLGWRKAPKPGAWDAFLAALPPQRDAAFTTLTRDLSALFGDGRAFDEIKAIAQDRTADLAARQSALKTLIESRPPELRDLCEALLDDRDLSATAARGLAGFSDASIGETLARQYRRFYASDRPAIIELLVSRPAWARALLGQMQKGAIPKSDLSAFQARQIRAFNDAALSEDLARAWGEARESEGDKRQLIAEWKARLTPQTLAGADLGRGRQVFQVVCATCHVMYGEGVHIGPDLTGSGRADLDYLLENIADPSAVLSADYRLTTLSLKDGRSLSGVVAAESNRSLRLRQLTGELTVNKDEIAVREAASLSMMPDGLLQALSEEQVRDLIAYLRHPRQVPLPEANAKASP